jgi:hypothetical protein
MAEQFGPISGREFRQLFPSAPSVVAEFTRLVDSIPIATLRGMPNRFINMAGLLTPDRHDLGRKALAWLEDFLSAPSTATTLASKSDVLASVEDPRVREYTLEERHANLSWMKLGAEIASVKMIAEVGYALFFLWFFLIARFLIVDYGQFGDSCRVDGHTKP